jgi:hypothetical protein
MGSRRQGELGVNAYTRDQTDIPAKDSCAFVPAGTGLSGFWQVVDWKKQLKVVVRPDENTRVIGIPGSELGMHPKGPGLKGRRGA